MATTFACQSRVRVGCGLVGVVAPLLAVEIHRRIAGIVWGQCRLILPLKTLVARPSFEECPVYAEVFVKKKSDHPPKAGLDSW